MTDNGSGPEPQIFSNATISCLSARDLIADVRSMAHCCSVKRRTSYISTGARVLFGCVGFAMLTSLVHDVSAGEFNMNGESFRRADHPFGFWLYAAFLAGIGLAALYGAMFGDRQKPEP